MSDYRIFETEESQRQLKKATTSRRKVIEKRLSGHVYAEFPTCTPVSNKPRGYGFRTDGGYGVGGR